MEKVSVLQVAAVIGKYKNGGYASLPHLIRHFTTDRIRITCDKPTSINLDGELRTAQVIDMALAEEKVRFFYPRGLSFRKNAEEKQAVTV